MPTQEEMEAKMKKAATLTDEHAFLKQFVGQWDVVTKWWMAPNTEPNVSKGTAVDTMIMGGKFLREDFRGTMMGRPFEGLSLTGFDTILRQSNAVWLDSASTAIMVTSGSVDLPGKTLQLSGEASCPMSDDKKPVRYTIKVLDQNHHIFEFYGPGMDGKEFRAMEIDYRRVGSKRAK